MTNSLSTDANDSDTRANRTRHRNRYVWFSIAAATLTGLLFATYIAKDLERRRRYTLRVSCAMHIGTLATILLRNFDKHGTFPTDIIDPMSGKRLLSWRVRVLEELNPILFHKFKLNQSWDSDLNICLLREMPKYYACPESPDAFANQYSTYFYFQPFRNQGSPGAKVRLTGGDAISSKQILLLEALNSGVPWTKPFDITEEDLGAEDDPSAYLSSGHSGGAWLVTIDGRNCFVAR